MRRRRQTECSAGSEPPAIQRARPMRSTRCGLAVVLTVSFAIEATAARPVEPGKERPAAPKLDTDWRVLVAPARRARPGRRALPESAPIKPLSDFELTGPKPGDAFQLGNFAADGKWGIQDGGVV